LLSVWKDKCLVHRYKYLQKRPKTIEDGVDRGERMINEIELYFVLK